MKNHVVTMIENSEGYGTYNQSELGNRILNYLNNEGYSAHGLVPCNGNYNGSGNGEFTMVACLGGTNGSSSYGRASACPNSSSSSAKVDCQVAIYKADNTYSQTTIDKNNPTCVEKNDCCAPRSYYRVITFFQFNLPVVDYISTFPVRGETKTIYDYSATNKCH